MSRTVEFYYDFSSPNAYFAALLLPPLVSAAGAKLVYRPILLGGLFKDLGTPPAPGMSTPLKAAYTKLDLDRWSARHAIPFKFPSIFPMNTVRALRLALALEAAGINTGAWVNAVMHAYWADDRDISSAELLTELLAAQGHDAAALLARTEQPELKERLKTLTSEAKDRGVFGVPSMFVGDELFFGKDRLEFVADALRG